MNRLPIFYCVVDNLGFVWYLVFMLKNRGGVHGKKR